MAAPGASGPIPTAEPPAWARVRLIEGDSAATVWQVDSSTPAAQLGVGAQEGCAWRVTAPRVAPLHFELCWDGSRLWIGDTQQAGGVTVDGAPLAGWLPVSGRARIEFGGAAMLAESSQPAVSVAAPERAAVDDDDEATRIRPDVGRGAPPAAEPPRIDTAEEPTIPVTALRPETPAAARPRRPAPDPAAQTIIAEIYSQPPAAYVPNAPMGWADSAGPPPAKPGTPPPPGAARLPQPNTPPPPGAARLQPGPPPPRGPFAHAAGTPPEGSRSSDKIKSRLRSIPPRTLALGGITAAALALVLLMGGSDEAAPRKQRAEPAVAAAQGGAEPAAAAAPDEASTEPVAAPLDEGSSEQPAGAEASGAGAGAKSTGADDAGAAAAGAETATDEGAEEIAAGAAEPSAADDDPDALASEKKAADLLAAGRQREALAVYDELARRFPDRPAFAAIVTILERELQARCPKGDESCAP